MGQQNKNSFWREGGSTTTTRGGSFYVYRVCRTGMFPNLAKSRGSERLIFLEIGVRGTRAPRGVLRYISDGDVQMRVNC